MESSKNNRKLRDEIEDLKKEKKEVENTIEVMLTLNPYVHVILLPLYSQ